MALISSQITVLHWFYRCHKNNEPVTFNGSITHFGEVMKIHEPMDVIKSLLDQKLIKIEKTGGKVTITKDGIDQIEQLKKKNA